LVNLDTLHALITTGEQAAGLVGPLQREVDHRTQSIISRLVAEYRARKLTGELALLAVAEIAGLRSLLSDLQSQVRQGQEAVNQLQ
jgi:hypothetical protein